MSIFAASDTGSIQVQKVAAESIPVLQSLAHITWELAYKDILSPEQMSYMLQLIYSTPSLQNQIEKQGHQFIIVRHEESPVGFASYSLKKADIKTTSWKLHKIYIHPNQQGKGTGKILLDYIVQDIQPTGAKALELNVNRHNKAIGFYQKMGFKIIAEEDIDIGNGYFMNDYVMRLSW